MTTLYGISNCDTVKKARAWLTERDCAFVFHDFKKLGVPPQELARWTQTLGWWNLINRRGSTWRKLDPDVQLAIQDPDSACALMLAQPSVIRRPVVDWGDAITVGFDQTAWNHRPGVALPLGTVHRYQAGFAPIFTAA